MGVMIKLRNLATDRLIFPVNNYITDTAYEDKNLCDCKTNSRTNKEYRGTPMKSPHLSRRRVLQLGALAAAAPSRLKGPKRSLTRSRDSKQADLDPPTAEKLSTKGLFMHAWDLRDEGADQVMGWMSDSGLNQMCIASCYHSGWFVHPHNPRHRTYMTEGSVAYFQPELKLYERTPMRPQLASIVKEANWLAAAAERLQKFELKMISWTIGAHNTRLGLLFPQYTVQNAYGDSIPHALSIGHDATREYLKALCRDLASNYPMYGLQLESFGWMELHHGHHHERDLTGLTRLEQELLTICFNPETVHKAEAAGIDVGKAREIVKATLEAAFREAPERPKGHPQTMDEMEAKSPTLKAYNQFRQTLADSLIVEIKQEALKGTACRLMMQNPYRKEIAQVCDGFATWAYGEPPARVLEIVRRDSAKSPEDWQGEFPCYIRLGMGIPSSKEQLREIVLAVKQGGSTGPIFYNYSESPRKMLGWIKSALKEV
jgi:hypothetical protein